MKNKKIILTLGLVLTLSACAQDANKDNAVTEETISQALDGPVEKDVVADKNEKKDSKEKEEKDDDANDLNKWRDMILNIGDFSPTLVKNLTDKDLEELIQKANDLSEETGYWDAKDFVFQELAKMYPELSNKFPLDSIENRYNQTAAEKGDYKGMFDHERQLMIDLGYPADKVWAVDDKTVQDAFHKAYEDNIDLYYDDYIKNAGEILFGDNKQEEQSQEQDDEETKNDEQSSETSDNTNKFKKFGSSQTDYDAIKSALVQYYEFSPATVNTM